MDEKTLREKAWLGDAVLGLYARAWILREKRGLDDPLYQRMTGNQTLSPLGRPTEVEARIGVLYEDQGLEPAFAWIEEHILPLVKKQLAREQRSRRGAKG